MTVTEAMRKERLIQHLYEEKAAEEDRLRKLEEIRGIPEIVILRNKKILHLAEIDQMIRKAK